MKMTTMNTIYNALTATEFEGKDVVMQELYNEMHRGDAAKAATRAAYDAAHDVVMETIASASAPVTAAEIFSACQDTLPDGMTKGKIAYALRVLWADEVTVTEGKVNTYSLRQ